MNDRIFYEGYMKKIKVGLSLERYEMHRKELEDAQVNYETTYTLLRKIEQELEDM